MRTPTPTATNQIDQATYERAADHPDRAQPVGDDGRVNQGHAGED